MMGAYRVEGKKRGCQQEMQYAIMQWLYKTMEEALYQWYVVLATPPPGSPKKEKAQKATMYITLHIYGFWTRWKPVRFSRMTLLHGVSTHGKYTWFHLTLKSIKRLQEFSFQNKDKYFGCCGSSNLIPSGNITQSTTFLPQTLDTILHDVVRSMARTTSKIPQNCVAPVDSSLCNDPRPSTVLD